MEPTTPPRLSNYKPTTAHNYQQQQTVVAHVKASIPQTPVRNHSAMPPTTTTTTKKVRNLNLAKEQLYEMKKTIDAKVNLDKLETTSVLVRQQQQQQPPVTPSRHQLRPPTQPQQPQTPVRLEAKPPVNVTTQRTTPRKVKKRSGERSLTTGIIQENQFDEPTRTNLNFDIINN